MRLSGAESTTTVAELLIRLQLERDSKSLDHAWTMEVEIEDVDINIYEDNYVYMYVYSSIFPCISPARFAVKINVIGRLRRVIGFLRQSMLPTRLIKYENKN